MPEDEKEDQQAPAPAPRKERPGPFRQDQRPGAAAFRPPLRSWPATAGTPAGGSGSAPNSGAPWSKSSGDVRQPSQEPRADTQQEVAYLRRLIDRNLPVTVKLRDGQLVHGVIEYYDRSFIRLTREGAPNLFIFKKDISYLFEDPPPSSSS